MHPSWLNHDTHELGYPAPRHIRSMRSCITNNNGWPWLSCMLVWSLPLEICATEEGTDHIFCIMSVESCLISLNGNHTKIEPWLREST